jgi:DNA-binding response OmpR family regulator
MTEESKPKLLITEDDRETQRFLEIFLKRRFDLSICDSAVSLYDEIRKENYDMILMDISLNGKKDGLEITKELRSHPEYTNTPIICYTAHALQRDKINAFNAGCNEVLVKPVHNNELMKTLEYHLEESQEYN